MISRMWTEKQRAPVAEKTLFERGAGEHVREAGYHVGNGSRR